MAIIPNKQLKELKEEFSKADKNARKLIIERVINEGNFYLNKYYDYSNGDIREKIGYDFPAQLLDKALMLGPKKIISEITGISEDYLNAADELDENKESQKGEKEIFFDCLDLLIEINKIDETKELLNGSIETVRDIETKKKIGKIFREFRIKHFKSNIDKIVPFSGEFLRECEGVYFEEHCKERETCIYKNFLR